MAPQGALALLLCFVGVYSGVALAQSIEPFTSEPFTSSARWSHYLHRTYSPARMGLLAAETTLDQFLREPACWDNSASSYGQRYARAFDRRLIKNTAELGSGMLTGEDLRYRKSRSRSMHGRIWNVMQSSVTARMPDGRKRPAYTRFFAISVTDAATAHWTGQPIHTGWVFRSLGWSVLDQVQTNLLDEFGPDLRRFGGRFWDRARGR